MARKEFFICDLCKEEFTISAVGIFGLAFEDTTHITHKLEVHTDLGHWGTHICRGCILGIKKLEIKGSPTDDN